MAYNLQVVDEKNGITFNSKYENLSKYKKPDVEAKAPNGNLVKERTVYQDKVLAPGSTQRKWMDEDNNQYAKSELVFTYEGEEVQENAQTKVFHVEQFQPLSNYTDMYVIDKYYEVYPSDNKMKKDFDREIAVKTNLSHMYKLWKYLQRMM